MKEVSVEKNLRRGLFVAILMTIVAISHERGRAQSVTLIDTLNRAHGLSGQNTKYSSCWGWVSPDGREYAMIGTFTGTSIIDLNVSPIREIGFVPGNNATYCYREIKTYHQYAYVVSEGGRGVQILNLSRLPDTSGLLVREFNYTLSGKSIITSHTVALADGYLYLNGSNNWSPGGIVIFSLRNDPTNPQYVASYEPQYVHDSYIRNDTLYAAAINSGGGLYVVDIHDKANPIQLAKISYTGNTTHHAWASISGRYAMTADETSGGHLKIWDLQNLGSGPPFTPAAQYTASPSDIIHNVHGRGNYAYASYYTAGMRVVDVHDPANPIEAGFYDTYPGSSGGYAGCWGVYPYFFSGKWIGSDMQTGLYVCRFSGLVPRLRSPLLAPAAQDTFKQGVSKIFRWRSSANQTEDPHYYEVHMWGAGLDTLVKTRDTSMLLSPFPAMQNGQPYKWHVWIKDEFTEVSSRDTFQLIYKTSASTGVNGFNDLPKEFSLAQNYPNPFNPTTTIEYSLPQAVHVSLKIYNALGEQVSVVVDETQSAGVKKSQVEAGNLSSGVYFYRLVAGNFIGVRKFILMK